VAQNNEKHMKMKAKINSDIENLKKTLSVLKKEKKVLLAYLFGSYAAGTQHKRSDIDIALYLNAMNESESIDVIDKILMSTDKSIEILRLDDADESPFIVQKALKGIPLVDPEQETLYGIYHRVLHETESIRARREIFAFK
jgi:uncharacterized protein